MQEDLLQPSAFQVTLRCKDHKQGLIVKGCVEKNCKRKKILLCQQCLNEDAHMEHNNNVIGIKQFIAEFSQSIYQATQQNKTSLEQFLNNDENLKVYKYIQDNKHHLKKVKDNIDTQKTLVAQDMTFIVEQFQLYLQQIKENVFRKLDLVYSEYESLFEQTRKQFNSKFFAAANYFLSTPMALTCKLGQQGDNSEEYLRKLKLIDNTSLDSLQDLFTRLLLANESPKIFESDQQRLYSTLQEPLQNYFLGWCSNQDRLPQPPQLVQQYSNNSNNFQQNQVLNSPQQRPILRENYQLSDSIVISKSGIYCKFSRALDLSKKEWPHIKLNRKFTLDFTIGAVIGLSKTTFVMIGQNDLKMRVFDTEKKSLLAFDGHTQQVNWIEPLSANTFITGADDGQVYYWIFQGQTAKIQDQYTFSNKPILAGLDLQNNSFAFVDSDGRLGYKNITTKLELFLTVGNSRLQGRLRKYKMALIKPGELFCVYVAGEQGATIIQVNEKEKQLRKVNANTLPCSQTIIPLSINEMLIASSNGVKICNTNRDDILQGNDVDVVLMEFTLSQIMYAICIPVEIGQCMQYRIQKKDNGLYDIQQKDLTFDGITYLSSKLKPRVQLIKNQDKVIMVIVDQNKINFFDITMK
ncbi:unnamed protein product [Paramecium primaurelia]|uniref:Uncharacterized protein n=1 Tax=Paramecium primaurelia TaxID=5886 RepID=A0A8S1K050_PARPR|nr:unnamed protein product [Paramecium primaurelia]